MTDETVGSITALWRFPVKSMRGEPLQQVELEARGCVGDRAYALIDSESGNVVSAKSVRRFPDLLECRAAFVEPPRAGREMSPVLITLPDGRSVASDAPDVDRILSAYFRRDVTLARAAPADFTIDQYHPDVEGLDPAGHRDTLVARKLGSALFAELGQPSPVPVGAFFDVFPMSVLTTSTLDRLRELGSSGGVDPRRFRMNAIVETTEAGFVENGWVDRELDIGNAVRVAVAMADPRCVMTTLAQDDLPQDTDVLRTLARHNRIPVGQSGEYPCAGVYAAVVTPGSIRVGDPVALVPPPSSVTPPA